MNGKLCQIVAVLDENEQRYPVRVLETRDIVLIKPLNLKPMDKGTVFIKDIRIYPIKGCAPISLSVANVEEGGFRYDREYCLMSTLKRQKILNQQAGTALLWIQSIPDEGGITISAPGMHESIYVKRRYEEKNRVCPKYWNYKDGISGFDQGDVASEWLTKYFILHGHKSEEKIRLILLDPHFERMTHDNVTSKRFTKETNRRSCVRFQNEFQFLVISQESIDGLNDIMKRQKTYNPEEDFLKVDRFRPSIVLSSNGHLPPHFEDMLGSVFAAGSIQFYHTKPADRCSVPTVCVSIFFWNTIDIKTTVPGSCYTFLVMLSTTESGGVISVCLSGDKKSEQMYLLLEGQSICTLRYCFC